MSDKCNECEAHKKERERCEDKNNKIYVLSYIGILIAFVSGFPILLSTNSTNLWISWLVACIPNTVILGYTFLVLIAISKSKK